MLRYKIWRDVVHWDRCLALTLLVTSARIHQMVVDVSPKPTYPESEKRRLCDEVNIDITHASPSARPWFVRSG